MARSCWSLQASKPDSLLGLRRDPHHYLCWKTDILAEIAHARRDDGVARREDQRIVDEGTVLDRAALAFEAEAAVLERRTGVSGRGTTAVQSEAILEPTSEIIDRVGHLLGRREIGRIDRRHATRRRRRVIADGATSVAQRP